MSISACFATIALLCLQNGSCSPARSLRSNVLLQTVPSGLTAFGSPSESREHLAREDPLQDFHIVSRPVHVGQPTDSQTMAQLIQTLSRFKTYADGNLKGVTDKSHAEEARLKAAIEQTSDSDVKQALSKSITSNAESLLETERIYNNMVKFSNSFVELLEPATAQGYGCESLACGAHAACSETTQGPKCVCNEGYVGFGVDCNAPAEFMPHNLLYESSIGAHTSATDMHVNVFDGSNKIAVVFRDLSQANTGRIVVGAVREAGLADLAPPEQFTTPSGRAFDPVVAGTSENRLAIAWRDENRLGTCWAIGAVLSATGVRGADFALTWGQPHSFCSGQSHKMALLSFPHNRIAVLFSDRLKATNTNPVDSYGNALLADISSAGTFSPLGQFRFTDYAVSRLSAVKVAPHGFVLAARGSPATDDTTAVTTRQEAMALYGEVVGNDLLFTTTPLNIEPNMTQIWSRGVSLIASNTVAYAYQHGTQGAVKMAVLEIEAATHQMKIVDGPINVHTGYSPYVSMLSVPYTPSDPHTLTYYQGGNESMVNLCSWSKSSKRVNRCEDFSWLKYDAQSVSGVHLGGGKAFMVFTQKSGMPYYGVFGLSKK